jgi:hypothetical protein
MASGCKKTRLGKSQRIKRVRINISVSFYLFDWFKNVTPPPYSAIFRKIGAKQRPILGPQFAVLDR